MTQNVNNANYLKTIPPLPAGEGRGEGESLKLRRPILRISSLITLLLGLWTLDCGLWTEICAAQQVQISLSQANMTPGTNRQVVITPLSFSPLGYIPLTGDRIYTNTDVNGNAFVTLWPGYFQLDVKPVWGGTGKTEFNFFVATNAVQSAYSNLLTTIDNTWPGPDFAWPASASDARYAFAGDLANIMNGNVAAAVAVLATNALTLANYGHVLILTNGYSGVTNWVPDTANPIQDALNYYTNNTIYGALQGELPGLMFTTNGAGGGFEIVGTFYHSSGWVIPNQYTRSGWTIYGQGFPNSVLIADSNVLATASNNIVGDSAVAGSAVQTLYGLTFVVSNESAKAVAVYSGGGAAYTFTHDNVWLPYNAFSYTNYYSGPIFGGSAFNAVGNTPQGAVDLLVDGSDGQQVIWNNILVGGADGIVCRGQHFRISNNEYDSIGCCVTPTSTVINTNVYATNDTSTYFNYAIQGADLALGSTIIDYGDDFIEDGDKCLSGLTGVTFRGVMEDTEFYGPPFIRHTHWEALKHDQDVIVADGSDGQTATSTVVLDGCFDQEPANTTGLPQEYTINTSTHVLSLGSGMTTGANSKNYTFQTGWIYGSTSISNRMYQWTIDNVPVMVLDPTSGKFWVTNKLVFTTNTVAP